MVISPPIEARPHGLPDLTLTTEARASQTETGHG